MRIITPFFGGGAIHFTEVQNRIAFENCIFIRNLANLEGGAIDYHGSGRNGQLDISNCIFTENTGVSGGSLYFINEGFSSELNSQFQFNIDNTQFLNNRARSNVGGALAFLPINNECTVYIDQTLFQQNKSKNGGGAMYLENDPISKVEISNCIFTTNQNTSSSVGGAIYSRTYFNPVSNGLSVINSVFAHNDGAIVFLGGTGTADGKFGNCTFFNNGNYPFTKAWSLDFDSTSFYNYVEFSNCIFWEPQAPLGRIFYNNNPDEYSLYGYNFRYTLISTDTCNLPGGDIACGEGILYNIDPLFVETDNNKFPIGSLFSSYQYGK